MPPGQSHPNSSLRRLAIAGLAAAIVTGTATVAVARREPSAAPSSRPVRVLSSRTPVPVAEPPIPVPDPAGSPARSAPARRSPRTVLTCPSSTPKATTVGDADVRSFDGVPIAVTVFRPGGVCAVRPSPLVLMLHGWSGRRDRAGTLEDRGPGETGRRGEVLRRLLGAGYGVLSVDARGHGDSGGRARFLDPGAEGRDVSAVLDWVAAEQAWMVRDGERDVRVGAVGASYGGATQLVGAALDARIDAVVPMVTWHDLAAVAAPGGVLREDWRDVIRASTVRLDPELGGLLDEATTTVASPLLERLLAASPGAWLQARSVPTLLVQATEDPLVPLEEARRTFDALRAAGTEAWMVAFPGVHEYPPPSVFTACRGVGDDLLLDFFAAHLRSDSAAAARLDGVPRSRIVRDGGCARWDGQPAQA